MDAASKLPSLYAELVAKSSRVAELEARISALETENAGLREALSVARREATGSTGEEEDPISRRLAPVLRGIKHEVVDKRGGGVARDAIEVSDDEEGAAAVGANKGGSPEEGVGEADAEDAEGGGGSNRESSAGLEDDDVSVTPRGKKRGRGAAATRVVTSDSEDDGGGDVDGLGSGKDDGDDQEGLMSSRKRAFRRVSDSEDEDGDEGVAPHQVGSGEEDVHDMVPIYELLKRRGPSGDGDESDEDKGDSAPVTRCSSQLVKRVPSEDDDESDEAKGHSAPVTRRSARLVKNQSKSNRVFRGVSDSEDEDGNEGIAAPQAESGHKEDVVDMVPIYELLKRVPSEDDDESDEACPPATRRSARLVKRVRSEDDDESDEAKGHSAPATRRSARLVKNHSKSDRVFRGVSDSEDEDGNEEIAAPQAESGHKEEDNMVPIYKLLKRMPKERASEDGDESYEAKGHSAPATRRSARLVKKQSKSDRVFRGVSDSEDEDGDEGIAAPQTESGDEEDDMVPIDKSCKRMPEERTMILMEESCDESDEPSVLNEKSSPGLEMSDGEVDYKDVMACIGRKKKAKEWDYEADMLAAFGEHPELCLKAVCAIYRKGSRIAEFLLDGDRVGPLKKTVSDLDEYDRYAFEFCRKVASHYSKQLFAIYQNKEDPYFHP
ncbi:unnamed protein product [Miscanthus lutarioriparius]|uniref:Uncharacterized protein n=1 Tax=Miscanthus lutarioriparius TaxID=422564 RepID=A0A811PK47_9POAL|nr:unnamed protein product [Miscanthus lutarioriparius]